MENYLVGVGALLFNAQGCVLLQERTGTQDAVSFVWALPGGKVEPHETMAAAVAREINEELNVLLAPSRFTLFSVQERVKGAPPEQCRYLMVFLHATLTEDEIGQLRNLEPDKCGSFQFFSPVTLPTPMLAGDIDVYQACRAALHFANQ